MLRLPRKDGRWPIWREGIQLVRDRGVRRGPQQQQTPPPRREAFRLLQLIPPPLHQLRSSPPRLRPFHKWSDQDIREKSS
jgi:hypothetical protein